MQFTHGIIAKIMENAIISRTFDSNGTVHTFLPMIWRDKCIWYKELLISISYYITVFSDITSPARTCMYMVYTKNYDFRFVYTCLYLSYTWYISVCTWFIRVHPASVSYLENAKPFSAQSISQRHAICSGLNRQHTMLYYSSVQESAILYMQGSYRSVLPENGSGMWSAFLWHFFKTRTYAYVSVCTCLNHVQLWLYTKKAKCHKKADHMPKPFSGSTDLYEPCIYRIADSCTLAWYSASWRRYKRENTLVELRYYMYMYIHHIYMYVPNIYMYIQCIYRWMLDWHSRLAKWGVLYTFMEWIQRYSTYILQTCSCHVHTYHIHVYTYV
jgi:hypothetical protein